MLTHAGLTYDAWLAEQLERPVFRIMPDFLADPIASEGGLDAIEELRRPPVFAYARVPVEATDRARLLEQIGFRIVDAGVVLERAPMPVAHAERSLELRQAEPDDEAAVVALARRSFTCSRFHLDGSIGPAIADRIKGEWSRSFFRGGRGDTMSLAVVDGSLAGFLLAINGSDGVMTIDLVAVDEQHRGCGIAGTLTAFAQSQHPGARRLRAGTQLANLEALRCYQRLGFEIVRAEYVLHFHNPAGVFMTQPPPDST